MKLTNIKTALAKILAQFERVSTDKGLLSFDGDELEVGMTVSLVDEEGNESKPEDGEYATDDGIIYVIADGKVAEIRELPKEETTGDDVQPEDVTDEVEEEAAEEEPAAEEEAPAEEPEADPRDERIANLEAEVARLEEELGAARERIAELEQENEDLKNKPAAEPAEEEFAKVNKVEKTGNRKLDNLNRILNA